MQEGGGHNYFDEDMVSQLQTMDAEARKAFILMQRVHPTPFEGCVLQEQQTHCVDLVSELGVFSSYVRQGDDVLLNEYAGYLVRSKDAHNAEGGIASGNGVIDSIVLM
jgi:hypothetical protein